MPFTQKLFSIALKATEFDSISAKLSPDSAKLGDFLGGERKLGEMRQGFKVFAQDERGGRGKSPAMGDHSARTTFRDNARQNGIGACRRRHLLLSKASLA